MKEILTAWQWDGPVSEPIPYGEGHINQTYAITVTSEQGAKRYILQKNQYRYIQRPGRSYGKHLRCDGFSARKSQAARG